MDEFDPDGEIEGCLRIAVERITDQHGERRADALATREHDVAHLLAQLGRLCAVEYRLETCLDAVTTALEWLHLPVC